MSQTANAIGMYRASQGDDPFTNGAFTGAVLISSGYLKSLPVNPNSSSPNITLVAADGDGGASSKRAETVVMYIPGTDAGKLVCESIQRQVGQISGAQTLDASPKGFVAVNMVWPQGCFFDGANFFAYSRI